MEKSGMNANHWNNMVRHQFGLILMFQNNHYLFHVTAAQ
jgi:hypothetical protein